MIEKIVKNYLERVVRLPVMTEREKENPEEYIIIEKTAGGRKNFINNATIVLKSHGKTMYRSAELNEKVKDAMDRITVLDEICKSEENSDYNYTNIEEKQYRYQAVYDLVYY